MGFIALSGDDRGHYAESLLGALDRLENRLPSSDAAYFSSILRVADFGKDFAGLETIYVDEDSGLPSKKLFDVLEANKKIIERDSPNTMLLKEDILESIERRAFQNDFAFEAELDLLREYLFTERLREMNFSADYSITARAGPSIENGECIDVVVRGYDFLNAAWMRYNVRAYQKAQFVWQRKLSRTNLFDTGKSVSPTKLFKEKLPMLFGAPPADWFALANATSRMGFVQRAVIQSFYFDGVQGELAELVKDSKEMILDALYVEREDTDLTLSEELEAEFFTPGYSPEIVETKRRFLIPSPGIAGKAREYALRQPYKCEVLE
jgi:hypothetical protein